PRRWRGTVPVQRDGEWGLSAEAASGKGAWRWRVSALADAPPVLTVAAPAGDLDLPTGSLIPYDLLAQDDLGLSSLALQFRKQAEEMKRADERQRDMAKQLDRAADETHQSISDAAERDAFRQDLTRKLREMSDLVRQIQSPEFKDALERMQKAIERMDRAEMER